MSYYSGSSIGGIMNVVWYEYLLIVIIGGGIGVVLNKTKYWDCLTELWYKRYTPISDQDSHSKLDDLDK